jgi:hypothetical protein
VRGHIGQDEGNRLTFLHRESAYGVQVLSVQIHGCAQHQHRGSGNRRERFLVQPVHPRHREAVAKTDHEVRFHRHLAFATDHQSHDRAVHLPDRHEIDDGNDAVFVLEAGLQDQAAVLVVTANLRVAARRDFPAAILDVAQQRRETCIRIETRGAEPVDRTVATDQRSRAHVADHRVVFDLAGFRLVRSGVYRFRFPGLLV